jgi:hypothetical protein
MVFSLSLVRIWTKMLSNAATKSYGGMPISRKIALTGSSGLSPASKRKIYLSEKRKVMEQTTITSGSGMTFSAMGRALFASKSNTVDHATQLL